MNGVTPSLAQSKLLVNWGCSTLPVKPLPYQVVINPPDAVARATNKLTAFAKFTEAGVSHPSWWTEKEAVDRKSIVLARTKLTGSGGDGIVVCREGDVLPPAKVYTKYIRKNAEYRLHVFRGAVILIQQKRRDTDAEQTKDQQLIRNHANGWVFAVNDVSFRDDVQRKECEQLAVSAVNALGLDFGAVDLITSLKEGKPYVLEVNTAPGIESPTVLAAYTTAFTKLRSEYPNDVQRVKEDQVPRPRSSGKRYRDGGIRRGVRPVAGIR